MAAAHEGPSRSEAHRHHRPQPERRGVPHHWPAAIAGTVDQKTWEGSEWVVRCHLKPGLGRWQLAELKALHLGSCYTAKGR